MDDIDRFIRALVRDITATDGTNDIVAVHSEPERRLLALLLAYQLGEELAEKVVGDSNNA
jgi:hypothetical protein